MAISNPVIDTSLVGMGVFGQMHGHRDTGDDAAGYTCMMSNTNVPEGGGTEMGRFFILNNLIYVKMVRFSLPIFNGLFLHGGSPIILGRGIELKKNLYRINAVLYSPRFMLSGAGQYSIGFAKATSLLKLRKSSTNKGTITREANFVRDGIILMEPKSLFNFVIRGLLQISAYIVRQLPLPMGVRIDQAKFTSAFTMQDNMTTITAEPWPEAPDGSVSDPILPGEIEVDGMDPSVKAAHIRKKIHMEWIDHKANMASFIPSQWGHVKDYTDTTSQDTEVDRPKHVGGGISRKNKNEGQNRERELQHCY
ncbi:uncharacterized protein LACBIDRAFT_335580 [Laccaria bicolor S238N-H82]|uniref:Predicted protein n=1 Tax=Laccaria bicolor (strain S238N-H82 / ATCC MYA-4686) TaxID=486041 RepID=B0E2Q4_LACBS|nr:uncharacterized protein LACBIDRAFT_335580 [Laccaria bicolor S238N-H82]EDQ98872.1 predicted protein [Laccaria bicolor S238N-H82]|eukprot:XP_001890482.1 predicted protein [Laccaria bicolor S238N-H82]